MSLGADFEFFWQKLNRAGFETEVDDEEQAWLKIEDSRSPMLIVFEFDTNGRLTDIHTE